VLLALVPSQQKTHHEHPGPSSDAQAVYPGRRGRRLHWAR
jgi:hypothetical protein